MVLEKITKNASKAILESRRIAKMSGYGEVLPEHLFIALTNNPKSIATRLLINMNLDLERLRSSMGLLSSKSGFLKTPSLSGRLKKIVRDSFAIARDMGHVYVGTEHLLLSLLAEEKSPFKNEFEVLHLNFDSVRGRLISYANYPPGIFTKIMDKNEEGQTALSTFGRDITEAARKGFLLPIIGRDEEIDRMVNILSRRTKNNPILIGDAGVGKTAVVEGLAQRIVSRDVPESMQDKRIISLDIASIVAGSKVRGELEEKLLELINEVVESKEVILFIDEVHMIVSSSGATGGASDIANILKPVLTDPSMKVIGATTFSEYKRTFDEDEALRRRFQPINVAEVDIADGIKILKGLQSKFEDFHNVKISDDSIEAAVKLSSRYIAERYLPDKAIDLIDEAAATVKINREKKYPALKEINDRIQKLQKFKEEAVEHGDYDQAVNAKKQQEKLREERKKFMVQKGRLLKSKKYAVDAEDIRTIVSNWTGIPVNTLTQSDKKILKNLSKIMAKSIIGQKTAVNKVAAALKRARVGIADEHRPLSSFIFLGPTGVGKTETAKVIARELFGSEEALIQIDMSELMEKHSVAKLIGSPPGYIGYQEGGQLTEKVRSKPYSVVLFDEIEKAHNEVLNILLQVLEEGKLTDGKGREVSFKNTIIIMTSNIGAEDIGKHEVLGFDVGKDDKVSKKVDRAYTDMKNTLMERLKEYLRPEFLNRLDEIIIFNGLDIDNAVDIVKIHLARLNDRLKDRGIEVLAGKKELKIIAKYGFSTEYGARPLKRALQELVESPLADMILDNGKEEIGKIQLEKSGKDSVKLSRVS